MQAVIFNTRQLINQQTVIKHKKDYLTFETASFWFLRPP